MDSDFLYGSIENRDQAINRVESRIDRLNRHLDQYPGPYDPLNGIVYVSWERRGLLWTGDISGRLAVLGALKVVPWEQAEKINASAKAAISRATAKIMIGVRE